MGDISEEAKELIAKQGFGKPQKIEAPQQEEDAKGGGSKWNQAGTYEEKGMLKWVKEHFSTALVGLTFNLPTGSGGVLRVSNVTDFSGDASISVSRGKRRHLLDMGFKVEFEGTVGEEKGTGTFMVTEVTTGDDEPEVNFEIGKDTAPSMREVFNAFAKPAGQGLMPTVVSTIKKVIDEYKQQ